jgi:hypothetical protein
VLFVGVTGVFTFLFEGRLVKEALGYLRSAPAVAN